MDILLSFLIALGLHATPQDLKDKNFLAKNAAVIEKAKQLMSEQGNPRVTQKSTIKKSVNYYQ